MDNKEVLEVIKTIIENVLGMTNLVIADETTANDVDGWNSLTNMQIISELEKHFDIKFKLREIIKTKNVGDLCSIINKKLESK
jgi:acyl carrier protein